MKSIGWLLCIVTIALSLNFVTKGSVDQQARDLAANQSALRSNSKENHGLPLSKHQIKTLEEITDLVQ